MTAIEPWRLERAEEIIAGCAGMDGAALPMLHAVQAAFGHVPRETVARALAVEAARRDEAVEIVRTGSRGMFWLEPTVEVETASGRIAYGPAAAKDVPGLFAAGFLTGGDHPIRLGDLEDHPWLAG